MDAATPGSSGNPVEAAAPAVPSRIAAVTVFHTGALVERVAELVPTASGYPDAVRLPGLPLCLDDASVRLRIEIDGDPEAADPVPPPVAATDVRVALEVPEPDPELRPPRDEELRDARRAVRRLEESIAAAEVMIARLETLKAPPRPRGAYGEPPPPSPAAARLALLDFRGAELERLNREIAGLEHELREAEELRLELEDRHRRASSARRARPHELRKTVLVRLRPETEAAAGPCRLVVRYLVPGARWAPGYTVRFEAGFGGAELALRALVCQATGEDWKGVRLTLSTAEPQRWCELPELRSLRIGRRQPPPPRTGWRAPPAGTAELFADYDRERKRLAATAEPAPEAAVAAAAGGAVPEMEDLLMEPLEDEIEIVAAGEPVPEADLDDDTQAIALGPPQAAKGRPPKGRRPRRAEPAFAAAAPPPPDLKMKRGAMPAVRRVAVRQPPPGSGEPANDGPAADLRAPERLLDYGRLRLAGAGEQPRGQLRPAADDEGYLELLTLLQVEVRFDLLVAVRRAGEAAVRAARTKAPAPYVFPRAWRGFDHSYAAEAEVDVAADGAFHNVPLLARRLASELRYVAVPRETPQAFRLASFENPLSAPLPRGPAEVYVGDDFLLTSTLEPVAPGGTAELGLGVDEGLKIARNTRFREQAAGLVRGRLDLEHEVTVEVANRLFRALRCEIRERLPVVREGDDVEVEVLEVEPSWERFDQPRRQIEGGHRWRLTLAAGESRTLVLRYMIRLPAKYELAGGNRRER